jgi:tetratricopeptide (TPR) repeat protein
MRSMRRLVWLLLLLGVAPLTARAQPQPVPQQEEEPDPARIHFDAGEQHYIRGRYSEAIIEFKEAYRLSKAGALLYNIAQAYERAGDPRNAKDFLEQYIASGQTDPGELPGLQKKLAEYDEQIAKLPPPEPDPVPKPAQQVDVVPGPFGLWKWVALGGGVLLGGTAIYFALDARKQADKIEEVADRNPLNVWDDELDAAYSRGKRSQTLAIVTGGVGAAAVVTGIVLLVLDRPRSVVREISVVPTAGPGGAGATLSLRF